MSIRGFISLFAPLLAPYSEQYGRRPVLAISMLLLCAASIPAFFFPSLELFAVAILAAAMAKILFDPAMQSYLGDIVPYRIRGRAISITELAWSGAFLIGVPLLSLLMARKGWSAPFGVLGVLALLSAAGLWLVIPKVDGRGNRAINIPAAIKVVRGEPVIWAAATYNFLAMAGNELLLIVYGDWMESNFSLSLTSLGLATAVIGAADVSGELVIGQAVDRFGKRVVVIGTGLVASLLYFLVPLTGQDLPTALVVLFFLFFFFEMTVVGAIPLQTEVVPSARGVVMSTALAAGGLGRGVGALLGQPIKSVAGFEAIGLTSSLLMISGILVLARWVKENQSDWSADRVTPSDD